MREAFGEWGVALEDEAFARAVAYRTRELIQWDRLSLPSAARPWERLRAAWAHAAAPLTGAAAQELRIVLPPMDPVDDELARFALAVLEWSSRGVKPTQSVVVSTPAERPVRRWRWPLRVGIVGQNAPEPLMGLLAERQFLSVSEVSSRAGDFDVVLVAAPLRRLVSQLVLDAQPFTTSALIVLGGSDDLPAEHVFTMATATRQVVKAHAVIVAEVAPSAVLDWTSSLTDALAHDLTLDQAAFVIPGIAPLIFGGIEFLDSTRVSERVRAIANKIGAASAVFGDSLPPLRELPGMHDLNQENASARAVAEALISQPDSLVFGRERDAATGAAILVRKMESGLTAAAEGSEPRFLQTRVMDGTVPTQVLQTGRSYRAVVWIGLPREDALVFPNAFPRVSEDDEPHELVVVFEEPRLLSAPQHATILLPPTGDSESCSFHFYTRPGVAELYARIAVLHRGRILQTGVLRGTISDHAEAEPDLEFTPDALVRRKLQTLGARSRFSASIVTNHDDSGVASRLAVFGTRVKRVVIGDTTLREIATRFNAALSDIAAEPDSYATLRSKGTLKLLRDLAQHGAILHEAIIGKPDFPTPFAQNDRIQVVTARCDGFLPVELAYRFEAPEDDAELCEGAERALRDGVCPAGCTGGTASRLCALGFWCTSKTIERFAHTDDFPDGDVHDLYAEPIGNRPMLDPVRSAVVAAAKEATQHDADAVKRVVERLVAHKIAATQVDDWSGWVQAVSAREPALLVLLPHHVREDGNSMLAIGADSKLKTTLIKEKHVIGEPAPTPPPRPIAFLLGCETQDANISIERATAMFLRRKAVIVIGTIATVLGRHAAPTATELIDLLRDAQPGMTFGDVMLAARRRLLLGGNPMALAIASFGDADWRVS